MQITGGGKTALSNTTWIFSGEETDDNKPLPPPIPDPEPDPDPDEPDLPDEPDEPETPSPYPIVSATTVTEAYLHLYKEANIAYYGTVKVTKTEKTYEDEHEEVTYSDPSEFKPMYRGTYKIEGDTVTFDFYQEIIDATDESSDDATKIWFSEDKTSENSKNVVKDKGLFDAVPQGSRSYTYSKNNKTFALKDTYPLQSDQQYNEWTTYTWTKFEFDEQMLGPSYEIDTENCLKETTWYSCDREGRLLNNPNLDILREIDAFAFNSDGTVKKKLANLIDSNSKLDFSEDDDRPDTKERYWVASNKEIWIKIIDESASDSSEKISYKHFTPYKADSGGWSSDKYASKGFEFLKKTDDDGTYSYYKKYSKPVNIDFPLSF